MAGNEGIEHALRTLGLEDEEIAVLMTIVEHGELGVGDISKYSGIGRSKVYAIVDDLEKDGWIRLVSDHPRRYDIRDLDLLIKKKKVAVVEAINTIKKTLLPAIKRREKVETLVVRDFEVIQHMKSMVDRAKKYIIFIPEFLPEKMIKPLLDELKKASSRGVRIMVIIHSNEDIKNKFHELGEVFSNPLQLKNAGLMIVDGMYMLMCSNSNGLRGIYSSDRNIVSLTEAFLKSLIPEH